MDWAANVTEDFLLIVALRTLGFTFGGVPFFGAILWLIGRVAFRNRTPEERADLLPGWTFVVFSILWMLGGNALFAVMAFPSFVIDWQLYRWVVRRRRRRSTLMSKAPSDE